MYVRKKINASGKVSVQVIDKVRGKSKLIKTIGSSLDSNEVDILYEEGKRYIKQHQGLVEIDFNDYHQVFSQVFSSVSALKLIGIELVLGKIFDEIGFNRIQDELFRDLVLYRLVYPKSKLKTTEYLYRYSQKTYTEDDIYRYMDKLYNFQKDLVQQISYDHTVKVLSQSVHVVFYDVTTIYFETDREDDIRKSGFSKEGKHQNPQIVLGLLVSKGGYPLAYEIYDGKKFEGHTLMPIINGFKERYQIKDLVVVADSGLLSNENIKELISNEYQFILGARIKNEKQEIKNKNLGLNLQDGQRKVIERDGLRLIIGYSEQRAKKDRYNREKGIKRLEKSVSTGKLTKASINNRGYNKFLELEGEVKINISTEKVIEDAKWDGLKGYLTNCTMSEEEILDHYNQLWIIEKAFRIAKTDLKIRPIYHYNEDE